MKHDYFAFIEYLNSGTSALSLFLSLHPNVSMNVPVSGSFEELQFFGGNNYKKGLRWYSDKFLNITQEESLIIFEKSANYFDSVDAPRAVHTLIPNTKLMVIVIDPADRAYSWYQVGIFPFTKIYLFNYFSILWHTTH